MAKPALGRGLGALLGGASPSAKPSLAASPAPPVPVEPAGTPGARVQHVPLERVRPCPLQPRKEFTVEALQELADSIREQGILQPLIVREQNGAFELIAGERRWRAARLAGISEVPIIVRQADDRAVLELALIENLQRENLNALEEAQGYAELAGAFALRQEEIAVKVGKSRAAVANALRLLKLPALIQTYLRDGRLTVGHAKVILGLSDADRQNLAAERIVKHGLNVRQTEELVSHLDREQPVSVVGKDRAGGAVPVIRDVHIASLETKLREHLGTKVQLRYRQGKGAIDIRFFSDDELERILQLLGLAAD